MCSCAACVNTADVSKATSRATVLQSRRIGNAFPWSKYGYWQLYAQNINHSCCSLDNCGLRLLPYGGPRTEIQVYIKKIHLLVQLCVIDMLNFWAANASPLKFTTHLIPAFYICHCQHSQVNPKPWRQWQLGRERDWQIPRPCWSASLT